MSLATLARTAVLKRGADFVTNALDGANAEAVEASTEVKASCVHFMVLNLTQRKNCTLYVVKVVDDDDRRRERTTRAVTNRYCCHPNTSYVCIVQVVSSIRQSLNGATSDVSRT